jgi:hypothetical protein
VVLPPATVYDHAAASAGQHFRLGLGHTNFKEALQRLEQWLQTHSVRNEGSSGLSLDPSGLLWLQQHGSFSGWDWATQTSARWLQKMEQWLQAQQ